MSVCVSIDGSLHGERDATISVFDRGFLYGDSVYEVMRTAGGRPVDLDLHLERLARSAAAIALQIPHADSLTGTIARTLAAAANEESYVRVVITRGGGAIGLDVALATEPKTIVIVRPLDLPDPALYERGAALAIVGVQRTSPRAVDPGVKSGNYLNSILALHEARRAGADEALMCDAAGRIAEGSSSNVFVVRDGRLATPDLEIGLLAGITRLQIIALARAEGIDVAETALRPDDLRGADEVFITSSIRGVMPATRVDGNAVGDGAVGAVTRRLMGAYARHLAEEAERGPLPV